MPIVYNQNDTIRTKNDLNLYMQPEPIRTKYNHGKTIRYDSILCDSTRRGVAVLGVGTRLYDTVVSDWIGKIRIALHHIA